jgi:ankyrin repeat protein
MTSSSSPNNTNEISDNDNKIWQAVVEHRITPQQIKSATKQALNKGDRTNWTALLWATRSNDIEIVQLLLEAGADPDIATHYHRTPLIEAVENSRWEITELLLKYGANPNQRGPGQDENPLSIAIEHDIPKSTLTSFCLSGAELENQSSKHHETALEKAQRLGKEEIILFLKDEVHQLFAPIKSAKVIA